MTEEIRFTKSERGSDKLIYLGYMYSRLREPTSVVIQNELQPVGSEANVNLPKKPAIKKTVRRARKLHLPPEPRDIDELNVIADRYTKTVQPGFDSRSGQVTWLRFFPGFSLNPIRANASVSQSFAVRTGSQDMCKSFNLVVAMPTTVVLRSSRHTILKGVKTETTGRTHGMWKCNRMDEISLREEEQRGRCVNRSGNCRSTGFLNMCSHNVVSTGCNKSPLCILCYFKMNDVIDNPADCEVRSVIRFLNARHLKPAEIYRQLKEVYGDTVMNERNVRKWCEMFNNGRTNVHNETRPGRPSLITED
ncbi:hypothetical protein ANN_15109 [Periplaneta americana]|uniref:Mos1 transposase HTH domain-containing protein n=1 Tax=Periplaneta americana TaxID=6978 RepID=A0ABQ8SY66_PERAM|nr:hypothetical protein ANN_15109 [Periplaneta americana]